MSRCVLTYYLLLQIERDGSPYLRGWSGWPLKAPRLVVIARFVTTTTSNSFWISVGPQHVRVFSESHQGGAMIYYVQLWMSTVEFAILMSTGWILGNVVRGSRYYGHVFHDRFTWFLHRPTDFVSLFLTKKDTRLYIGAKCNGTPKVISAPHLITYSQLEVARNPPVYSLHPWTQRWILAYVGTVWRIWLATTIFKLDSPHLSGTFPLHMPPYVLLSQVPPSSRQNWANAKLEDVLLPSFSHEGGNRA